MCGITGFIDFTQSTPDTVLKQMTETLNHRGPDDKGTKLYTENNVLIGLGQTRLSIIDLSPGGHQPMTYKNFTIIFNGEIYNYREIKEDLIKLDHRFKSSSDTEVILHAFEEWGTKCVEKFVGMFAFVIYDQQRKKIYAFRDRAGVKPFYYYNKKGLFIYGSELKALMQHPGFEKKIDRMALKTYFDFGYIPTPYCIFENAQKLEPGSYLEYRIDDNKLEHNNYWNAIDYYKQPKLDIAYKEAKEELHNLLKFSFQYRMVADVPVGVFLSGGYDSTAVTAILQNNVDRNLKTFTIGFEEGNNEAPFAKRTADYLGTNHYEFTCSSKEAQEIIPSLPYYYDEPFADSSAIPTILVSRFARSHVTVALSADGGDELFAGYKSYPDLNSKLQLLNKIPNALKSSSSKIFSSLSALVPAKHSALRHKLDGISRSLNKNKLQQAADLFRITNSLPKTYSDQLFPKRPEEYKTRFNLDASGFHNEIEIAMAVDYQSYLQNDILTKVDRATMSVSLEGRDPLVDHRLFEFAARLPLKYKYNGTTKKILKDIVHEYIPKEMMDRPKMGFSLPIYSWLRGDLSYLLDEFLNEKDLAASGIFNVPFLLKQVELFRQDELHYSPFIWKLLMFQMWYKRWIE